MQVTHLFKKAASGEPMAPVDKFDVWEHGIVGQVQCKPLRQVLMLPQQTLDDFNVEPGLLRENIVFSGDDIHNLESGQVLTIGNAKIRLTFHCDPCNQIKDVVNVKGILHRRGVLGQCLNAGVVKIGDFADVGTKQFETIPYKFKDRVAWYLRTCERKLYAADLMHEIGLNTAYCRALPKVLKNLPVRDQKKIMFRNA